jgi:hypothetical protein
LTQQTKLEEEKSSIIVEKETLEQELIELKKKLENTEIKEKVVEKQVNNEAEIYEFVEEI